MADTQKKKRREIDEDLARLEAALGAAYGGAIEPFEPFEKKANQQEEQREEKSS